MSLSVIILAAGKGSRMKSSLPKILHKIANKPIINHVKDAAKELLPNEIILTINSSSEDIKQIINDDQIKWAHQEQQLGTADATRIALEKTSINSEYVLILCGDAPLITADILKNLYDRHLKKSSDITLIAFNSTNPDNYGRLVIERENIIKIVEAKDASESELKINLCNSGIILIKKNILEKLLPLVTNNNSQKEYYLTDIIEIANKENIICNYFVTNENYVQGINTRYQLALAESIYQDRLRYSFMEKGVTLIDPKTVYFSYDTKIGIDVTIHPNVVLGQNVEIENNVEIKSFSHIEGALIKSNSHIGPFARIRPKTIINENSKIGNFVEIKNSSIDCNTQINHLSYIGDTSIGKSTNIGAGVITCNYDGFNKNITNIGNSVFVGSNSILIAPISIEDDSIIAAGSVINKDVTQNSLAISRPELKVLLNKASYYRLKKGSND